MDFKEKFMDAIKAIHNEDLREACLAMAEELPEYFWTVPASSSGKYHPACDLGEGGLVRHSLMVCKCGLDFLETEMFVRKSNDMEDLVRVTCLFHDGLKSGLVAEDGTYSDHTVFEHPRLASDFVRDFLTRANIDSFKVEMITNAIYTHMGKWCVDTYGEKKGTPQKALSKPRTDFEKLIHIADYTASRKYISGLDETEWKV